MTAAAPLNMGPTKVFSAAEVAELLDRVATLDPDTAAGLDAETACAVLRQLQELQRRRRRNPFYVNCPYCRSGFDIAHSRPGAGPPAQPPRHPDPIGAATDVEGARQAAQALGRAVLWGKDNLKGPEAFWVDVGRGVLWPLLLLARATGQGMDDVRLQAHPEQIAETLVSVGAALGELAPGEDSEAARDQWAVNSSLDVRCRRMAFTYAYRLVHYWQYTATWADSRGT